MNTLCLKDNKFLLIVTKIDCDDNGDCTGLNISTPHFPINARYTIKTTKFNRHDIGDAIHEYIEDINDKYELHLMTNNFNIIINDDIHSKPDIKLIDKNTDLTKCEIRKFKWDVTLGKNYKPYQVVEIAGYTHSIMGLYNGRNDLWAYPRDEEMSVDNLIEFDSKVYGPQWGLIYQPHTYVRTKYDESEICDSGKWVITRNGVPFYDSCYSYEDAKLKIAKFNDHPIDFNSYNWRDGIINRKVWWRSEPGIITRFIDGQGCVIIEPDGIEKFTYPAEYVEEDELEYDEPDIKTSVFDDHIYWFRN